MVVCSDIGIFSFGEGVHVCLLGVMVLNRYQSFEVGDWAVFGCFCMIRCYSYSFVSQYMPLKGFPSGPDVLMEVSATSE